MPSDLLAVWCTTSDAVTAQLDAMLAANFDEAPTAIQVADEQPMLYNSSVVFFFRNGFPAGVELRDFTLIFGEGGERVHNVIAMGATDVKFLSSAGEQNVNEHRALVHTLQSARVELLQGLLDISSLTLS